MTTRTAIHRPAAIQPEHYQFIAPLSSANSVLGRGFDPVSIGLDQHESYRATGQLAEIHRGAFRCDVCGAAYSHGAMFEHCTGQVITLGWICAEKMEFNAACKQLKKQGLSLLEAAKRKQERTHLLRNFVFRTEPEVRKALRGNHHITRDIRSKVINHPEWFKNGLSPKQAALVVKLSLQQAEQAESRAEAAKVSRHIGEVGKRMRAVKVRCEAIIPLDGQWGLTGLHKLVGEDGEQIVWFASSSAEWMEKGEEYRVDMTVKKQDQYQGAAQTTVTRVKITQFLGEDKAA